MKKNSHKTIFGYLFVLFILLSITKSPVYGQTPTLLGLHAPPQHHPQIGAQVLRFGINDSGIKDAIVTGNYTLLNQVKYLDSLGYNLVVYLLHNRDTVNDIREIHWQRIPSGSDKDTVFQYLDIFIDSIGPYVDWIQINQEPMGITKYDTIYTVSEILLWWRELAIFLDDKRTNNLSSLGHLKILSPGISGLNHNAQAEQAVDSIIVFGETYCDAIDLHMYPPTVDIGRQLIQYYRNKTSYTLTCTEFSQSNAVNYTGWFDSINTVWTNSGDAFYGLTNYEVIDSSYSAPMDSSDWKAFIATAPYTDDFIPDFYALMDSNCFAFACYAGMWQYEEPIFDWNQLIANKTVLLSQNPFPNNPFYNEFTSLTSLLNSGNYLSQCQTTGLQNSMDQKEGITFYPNPTNTHLFINSDWYLDNVELIIYNIDGSVVLNKENISGYNHSLNTSALNNGIYYIQLLKDNKSIFNNKLVIIK